MSKLVIFCSDFSHIMYMTEKHKLLLSHNDEKTKIFPNFWLLLRKYRFYGFNLGKIERSVANLCNFDENLAKIAQLEMLSLQKQIVHHICIILAAILDLT